MADNNGQLPFFLATGAAGALIDGIIGYATTGSWKGALAGAAIGLTGGAAAGYLLAGKAWHHIVEQTASNVSEFGAQTIHNAKNIVRISHGAGQLHNKISGYYSSIQRFTNGMTVRQWLQTKDYNFQYNFGLETLTRFAEELGAKIEFIE